MAEASVRSGSGNEGDRADVIEVILVWRDATSSTVLAVQEIAGGKSVSLSETGDLLVPREVLGVDCFEILRTRGGVSTVFAPLGAVLSVDGAVTAAREADLVRGREVAIAIGRFDIHLARVVAEGRPAGAPLESLKKSGAGYLAGSALAHAAAFAAVALFASSLGATEEDGYDRDRLTLIQHLLDASAAREAERALQPSSEDAGGNAAPGPQAAGPEGQAGSRESHRAEGRRAARGSATPEDEAMARDRALSGASFWATLGSLSPSAPAAADALWGREVAGSDDVNAIGHLFGTTTGDAVGTGGLALRGREEGGGGAADTIGMNGIHGLNPYGQGAGCDDRALPCIGAGRGIGVQGHVPRFKAPRYAEPIVNGGHLPPEIIQRIVRQNDGRYRVCYENGLRGNPSLSGRVTVKFVIDRAGAVAVASDGGSDIPDEGVRRCVVAAFAGLSFPPPTSGVLTVSYPIMFSPE